MEELIARVTVILQAMWRRRWVGLVVAWLVGTMGAVMLWRTPDRFEATARVYVDTKTVLKPLMRDLTVEPDVDQMLLMLSRTLINRPNVEQLFNNLGLNKPEYSAHEREMQIDRLMRDIKLASVGRDNIFTFSYRDPDPVLARQLVEKLVSLFVESDLGSKRRDVDTARDFIDQQIKSYEARLADAESKVKDFKLRNLGVSDSAGRDYFARITALTDELNKLNLDLRAAEQSRDALRRELSGESARLVPEAPPPIESIQTPEIDARIEAQRRQLDEQLRRFTELHPDVIATRRMIARLEEQRAAEVEAKRKAAAARPPKAPDTSSAAAQQTRLALAESEASVAALKVRVADTQGRLTQLRSTAARAPQVEAELAQLNRDYDVVRRNYEALVAQREKALMSEEVDGTRLARFRVIEPPRTSPAPVFPNRLAIAPALLVVALLAGFGASFLHTQLMPTVDSTRELQVLTGKQVLGSVSILADDRTTRNARIGNVGFAGGIGALCVVYVAWMVLLAMPKQV